MLNFAVVPLVGTWIEIFVPLLNTSSTRVVPLVGTWIEICAETGTSRSNRVVPLVGTWIEIQTLGIAEIPG